MKKCLKVIKCIYFAIRDTFNGRGIEYAGYLSFLFMISIFPFLTLFVASLSFVTKNHAISKALVSMILNSTWSQYIDALKPRIIEITTAPPSTFITIAILGGIWTASSLFESMRTIFNESYRVSSPPRYIIRRLFSILEFFALVMMLMLFLFIMIIIPNISQYIYDALNHFGYKFKFLLIDTSQIIAIRDFVTVIFCFCSVSAAYYFLPNTKQRFRDTVPGTLLVMVSWYIFSDIFGYYILYFPQVNLIYGSIAGIIIALLYFYISSIILIVGSQLNYHLKRVK